MPGIGEGRLDDGNDLPDDIVDIINDITSDGDGDGNEGTTQELLNYLSSTPQYRTVIEEPGDPVDINYLYDIGGDSIFAPNVESVGNERPYVYAKSGGMIQQTNLEQLLKLLGV